MKKPLLTMSALCFFLCAYSQELVGSAGANYKDANLNVAWSVGELRISTYESGVLSLTEGVIQSKTDVVLSDDLGELEKSELHVYPLPFRETLVVESKQSVACAYEIFNEAGKVVRSGEFTSSIQLDCRSLESGTYILKSVNQHTKKVEKIKLIKIN